MLARTMSRVALACFCGMALLIPVRATETAILTPEANPTLNDVPRVGLNLGGSSTWGAEQLVANVLKNPGFEAPLDRTLIVIKQIDRNTVVDNVPWLARADGFWNGAQFNVRTGTAAGSSGMVLDSRRQGKSGPAQLTLEPFPAGLLPGDALTLSVARESVGVPMWWIGGGRVHTSTGDVRPGSPGRQAARLIAGAGTRSQLNHYLDAIGERAGKLLPLTGIWKLSFWARGKGVKDNLGVRLSRAGTPAFLQKNVVLEHQWKFYEYEFSPNDIGAANSLGLSFEIESGEVLLDDVSLNEKKPGTGGFRQALVDLMTQLKPGYLRDWQGQLGDSLTNRLAPPFTRQPTRYRPGDAEQMYLYSLPEFLALCAAVGAQPWVIAPPLMNDAEWLDLGKYLANAAKQYGFREILVEFGNENWNEIFRPAGFLGEHQQAQASDRAFGFLKRGAGDYKAIIPIVNAQFVNVGSWIKLAGYSKEAARVAVAPYFLHTLNQMPPADAVSAAFTSLEPDVTKGVAQAAQLGKKIAVYEVNFHSTEGSADTSLRNYVVSGAHAGPALARRLLQTTLAGVREQSVYSLAGFDSFTGNRSLVRLWGIVRDLAPGQLRPTGLALQMLNQVYAGDVHASKCVATPSLCSQLTAAWFKQGSQTHLAVVSASNKPVRVKTGLPCHRRFVLSLLDGSRYAANNETSGQPQVSIQKIGGTCVGEWQFELPAHSLAIMHESVTTLSPDFAQRKTK